MFDREKFKALVHYICYQRSHDPSTLGAIKLNKILWLCDFISYLKWKDAITDARYVRRRLGPVPHPIVPILRELESEGVLTVRDTYYHGYKKAEYLVHRVASGDFLTPEEKMLVAKMIDFVCDEHTATSISERSHHDVWKAAQDGEEIPYYTVFVNPGDITQEDRDWAHFQLESGS